VIRDPNPEWDGPYPYEVLEPVGIGPESTQAEVRDIAFVLMPRGLMNPATQAAADQLRDPVVRLLADALMYDVDVEAALDAARERLARDREAAAAPEPLPPPGLDPELLGAVLAEVPDPVPAPTPEPELPEAEPASSSLLYSLIKFDQ
jgi:hypothetical protein